MDNMENSEVMSTKEKMNFFYQSHQWKAVVISGKAVLYFFAFGFMYEVLLSLAK